MDARRLPSPLALLLVVGCSSEPAAESPGSGGTGGDAFDAPGDVIPDAGAGGTADALADAPSEAPPFDASAFPELDPSLCPAPPAEDLHGFDAAYVLVESGSWQTDKAFYVLTLLDAVPDVQTDGDATLAALATTRAQALQTAVDGCNDDVACWGVAAKWSDSDMTTAADALVALAGASSTVETMAANLRKSGHAQLHAGGTDAELLREAWLDAASALNRGWDDYAAPLGAGKLKSLFTGAAASAGAQPFFTPLLDLVTGALDADARDEASRYEPLADGENQAALWRIPSVDFSKHPFAVIVVPGQGPSDLSHALDPGGQVRADQAAARYAAGLAPLIALSGGHVHPDRTPYSEAIEMKKYLRTTYDIPEDAIVVDPHARHTTTNLRNVARQLYRYGVPVDSPMLVTTDALQTLYIAAASDTGIYGARCLDELGYLPYRSITKLGTLDNCWIPAVESLYADARDLLDP